MTADAIAAWAHYLSFLLAFGCLSAELVVYRPSMPGDIVRRLRRIDAGYGITGLLIVATGLARFFHFGKGIEFYMHNGMFWVKMALIAIVVGLSIPPTLHFLRLPRKPAADLVTIDGDSYRRVRRLLWAEAIIGAFIPLAATLMARGIGLTR